MSNNLNILIMIAPVIVCMSVLWLVEDCFPLRTEFPVFWEFLGLPRNS